MHSFVKIDSPSSFKNSPSDRKNKLRVVPTVPHRSNEVLFDLVRVSLCHTASFKSVRFFAKIITANHGSFSIFEPVVLKLYSRHCCHSNCKILFRIFVTLKGRHIC